MTRAERRKAFWERNRKSGGYLLKKKIGKVLYSLGRAILVFGLCFLILQPMIPKISKFWKYRYKGVIMVDGGTMSIRITHAKKNFLSGNLKRAKP